MADFDALHALRAMRERHDWLLSGERVAPVVAAIIAVFAAIATLFAHHASIRAIAEKNEAILFQAKAADQYNYFESKRIKAQLDQGFIDSGIVASGTAGRRAMEGRIRQENSQADAVLAKAKELESESDAGIVLSERFMVKYENYQIAATLFEVSIVLASITALMRTRVFLTVAGGATLVGIGFFFVGLVH